MSGAGLTRRPIITAVEKDQVAVRVGNAGCVTGRLFARFKHYVHALRAQLCLGLLHVINRYGDGASANLTVRVLTLVAGSQCEHRWRVANDELHPVRIDPRA